jgi:hypothetical protein
MVKLIGMSSFHVEILIGNIVNACTCDVLVRI